MIRTLRSILTLGLLLTATSPAWSSDKADKSAAKNKDTAEAKPIREDRAAATHPLKVDINKADQATLEKLPGVGPAIAQEIIAARPFNAITDLKNVKGIGDKRFALIAPHVILNGAAGGPAVSTRGSDTNPKVSQRAAQNSAAAEKGNGTTAIQGGTTENRQNRPQRAVQP